MEKEKECSNCDWWHYSTSYGEPHLIGYCNFFSCRAWCGEQLCREMGPCNGGKQWQNKMEVKLESKGW